MFARSAYGQPTPLRFDIEAGTKFGYLVSVDVKYDDIHHQYGGIVDYEVLEKDAESIKLRFRGGLEHTEKELPIKARPGEIAIKLPKVVLADTPDHFPGLATQQVDFRLSKRGKVIDDAGQKTSPAALPFYIGDLRALIFQPLADDNNQKWETTRPAVTVSEDVTKLTSLFKDRARFDRQPATERLSFAAGRRRGKSVTITKSYALQFKEGKVPVVGTGSGQWQLDIGSGIPLALDEQRQLKIRQPNQIEVAQVVIRIRPMSAREISAVRRQMSVRQQADNEAARRQQDERARIARLPLTDAEARQVVMALRGDSVREKSLAFILLMKRPLARNRPEIVQALRQLAATGDVSSKAHIKGLELSWKIELDGQP